MGQRAISRRELLRSAAAATATVSVVPRHVLGQGPMPPSDVITSANIGLGGVAQGVGADRVLARCDVRKDKLKGYPDPKQGRYLDFRQVLERDDIDAISVGSAEQWHAIQIVAALRAGKDVYGEKPMSSTIQEAAAIRDAAKRHGRVYQHGTQRTSDKPVQFARELVRRGELGKIVASGVGNCGHNELAIPCLWPAEPVHPDMLDWDLWLGPAPWRPFNKAVMHGVLAWHQYIDFGRNMVNGGAVHPNDAVRHILGYEREGPVEIYPPDGKEYKSITTWKYADGAFLQVGFEGLPIPEEARRRLGGGYEGPYLIIGTKGKLALTCGAFIWADPPGLWEGYAEFDPPHKLGHGGDWRTCIRTREKPICNEDAAYQTEFLCHTCEIAQRLRRPLKWDPVKEEFIGDDEANRMTSKPYRAPWHL
ncbi:MAG: Gfo/Idh/MocA family oxidoreductase [Planctomycetes bacterium]|nr:Gfo/Idh/MocA family oxidoreductase [Planctomycetota bacterium]